MYLSRGTDRVNGVALRNDNRVSHSLIEWNPVSNRILTARIRQIVVYAPTEKTPVADNSSFYNHLESLVSSTPPCDQIVILGEFNAVIGTNRASYESVIGYFASGSINDISSRLLVVCSLKNLAVVGSFFRIDVLRSTWISNDGHTKKE